jgi:hypothetical protein
MPIPKGANRLEIRIGKSKGVQHEIYIAVSKSKSATVDGKKDGKESEKKEEKKPEKPDKKKPSEKGNSPRFEAMRKQLWAMTQKYEAQKCWKAIKYGLPIPGDRDSEFTTQEFKQWLATNGVELPDPNSKTTDTPYELRWAFFKASMESGSDRPSLWWYLWRRGVPYDPPPFTTMAIIGSVDAETGELSLSIKAIKSAK